MLCSSPKLYALGFPLKGLLGAVCFWQAVWVVLEAWLAPNSVACQALPCVHAAGCWSAGPAQEVADGKTPGDLRASAGSLMGGVRVQRTPVLLPLDGG